MSATEFRNSVKISNDIHELQSCGKICFYNGYIYISDPEKGIHIINNSNPKHPEITGYIELLGNHDLAIRNQMLYADAFVDLVWFDISSPSQPTLKGRLENAFPDALPVIDNEYGCGGYYNEDLREKGIITGWELKEHTETYVTRNSLWGNIENEDGAMMNNSGSGSMSTGVNGSMSRFTLYDKYLYVVLNYQMCMIDLSETKPVNKGGVYVGNVETIFNYKDNMFLGTPTGMSIYSVKDPLKPERCSTIWHVLGCDPVVVDNDLAYVTVHSGNFCGQNNDELFIVDVKDVRQPQQLVSYTMTNPKGLGIDNGHLFLCDDGLKIFKIDEPQTLVANQITHKKGMDGFDLIPYENVLMMIADDGLYQYDYSDFNNIRELSVIPIKKTKN
jgi:hypothetical protein